MQLGSCFQDNTYTMYIKGIYIQVGLGFQDMGFITIFITYIWIYYKSDMATHKIDGGSYVITSTGPVKPITDSQRWKLINSFRHLEIETFKCLLGRQGPVW